METVANSRDMQDADKDDAIVVAVTRDGRIYLGSTNVQKDKIRNRYLARLILWVCKASVFFFVRILRFPYLSGNREDDSKTVTRNKF